MGKMGLYYAVLLLTGFVALVQAGGADSCMATPRFKCIFGVDITQANCPGVCNWCPTLANSQKCSTLDRSCVVSDNQEEPSFTNEADCEGAGFVWCGGDTVQKCVRPEPVRSRCFDKFNVDPCTTAHTDEVSCNSDPSGCFWCTEGRTSRVNKCWALAGSCTSSSCCTDSPCKRSFTPSSCVGVGCTYCHDTVNEYCNHQPPIPLPAACPTGGNVEDCFAGLELDGLPTEELCTNMSCLWCAEGGLAVCKRATYPPACSAGSQMQCPDGNFDNIFDCKAHGCEWCGSGSSGIECMASTDCISCSCPNPVACSALSAQACENLNCLWCENGTSAGNCINFDAGGVTLATIDEFTNCTRTCGMGSQWRFSDCGAPNRFSCPREYQTCNPDPCPVDVCQYGERPRYMDTPTCCQSHTFYCGRNPLNENRPYATSNRRKKRVVGGMETLYAEKWPWMAAVYVNMSGDTSLCAGVLISYKYVMTAQACLNGHDPSDAIVHLDLYNRSEAPGFESDVVAFTFDATSGIALVELETEPIISDCIHPICMPNGEEADLDRKCIVAGWGLTNGSDPDSCSETLMEATVRIAEWPLCEQTWGTDLFGILDEDIHVCAGKPEGGPDFCYDTGAPLMCQRCEDCGWYVAGIATPFSRCGEPQMPGAYMRVNAAVQAWVETNVTLPYTLSHSSCAPMP